MQAQGSGRSLRDILIVLYRRRLLIAGVAGPIIAVGLYGALATIAHYTASSELRIEARGVEDPSFEQRPVEYDIVMSGAAQIAQSIPVATKAADAIWDSMPAHVTRNPELKLIDSKSALTDVILGGVSSSQVGESNLLRINYEHKDPLFALLIDGALTEAFISYNVEKGQNSGAVAYYDDQIAKAGAEIDSLLALRVAVFQRSGIDAFQVNNDSGIQQMRALESAYFRSRSNRMAVQDKHNGVQAAIAADADYMPSLSTSGQNANIIDARANYDKAMLDLAQLRMTYQEESPLVQRQLQFVEATRRIFLNIREDFVTDLKINSDMAVAEESALAASLEEYRRGIEAYPALQKELYTIDLQVDARRELLKALQTKRGEVRLKVQGDERISNITQLNAPSILVGVGQGKKSLYLVMAIVLALVLGVLIALLVDVQDHRIYDLRQAEIALELPVLGSISPGGSDMART
jgi:uncharacterized protein involved in exopolysaccharide biosynthesis